MDLNALRTKASDDTTRQIEEAVGRLASAIGDAAEDTSRPKAATLHLMVQMADAVERIVNGTYSTDGFNGLIAKQPLALSAGSAAPLTPSSNDRISDDQANLIEALVRTVGSPDLDEFLKYVSGLFAPFGSLDRAQGTARAELMQQVADGTYAVSNKGVTAAQQEAADLSEELRREKANAKVDRDNAVREAVNDAVNNGTVVRKNVADKAVADAKTTAVTEAITAKIVVSKTDADRAVADAKRTAVNEAVTNGDVVRKADSDRAVTTAKTTAVNEAVTNGTVVRKAEVDTAVSGAVTEVIRRIAENGVTKGKLTGLVLDNNDIIVHAGDSASDETKLLRDAVVARLSKKS
jgi:hypothetical protein